MTVPSGEPTATVALLAQEKLLSEQFLIGLGLVDSPRGVLIPYGPGVRTRLRLTLNGPSRFQWERGDDPIVAYGPGVDGAITGGEELVVVEGESDCWTLWLHGVPAIGLPGARQADKLEARQLLAVRRVYVVHEPDKGGQQFVSGVQQRVADLQGDLSGFNRAIGGDSTPVEVFDLQLPDGAKDPSGLHLEVQGDSTRFLKALDAAKSAATSLSGQDGLVSFFDLRPFSSWAEHVDSLGDPGWIAEPVWPGDAYGVIAAESKAGKTWAQLDLSLSVATGTKWMGVFPTEKGTVAVFLGEGGERNTVRRVRAIVDGKGLTEDDLGDRLHLSDRVPHLSDVEHLGHLRSVLAALPSVRLVILDPLYLAAGGANGASLYEMAVPLEAAQHAAESVGAALVIVHHFNQTGTGNSARRMSGAGPEEWGRVLATAGVDHSEVIDDGRTSVVDLAWEFTGGEIVPTSIHVRRTITTDDLGDLTSPMRYTIEQTEGSGTRSPAQRAVLEALRASDTWMKRPDIQAQMSRSISNRAVQQALRELHDNGEVERRGKPNSGYEWRITAEPDHTDLPGLEAP